MKAAFICMFVLSPFVYAETLHEVHKRHRFEEHEEKKKWEAMRSECYKNFPNWNMASNADYDGNFKCQEKIHDLRTALSEKQQAEICQKFNVSCRGSLVGDAK